MTAARRRRTAAIPAVAAEIKRYLWTGHTDASRSARRSVAFFTANNIDAVRRKATWDGSVWDLANLYPGSIGAQPPGPDAPAVVGISQEATCYVSVGYFDQEDPFADFLVHEVAHIFHDVRRHAAGPPSTRGHERMLDAEFGRRETFAYSCEAFARTGERAARAADRVALAREFGECFEVGDERVHAAEVVEIV